jgi:RNA polymerase sigma-70 factor (ECF subfamily)
LAFIHNISPSTANDNDLVLQYRQTGDIKILGALYERYMELVYGVCLKYLKEPEAAKDAVMEIFGQLGDKLMRHEVANFRSWLYSVAKNHCLMQLRSASKTKAVNFDEGIMQLHTEMHPPEGNEKEWQLELLTKCLETLSADQKQIISLFYLQEKCYKEIAEMSGFEWNRVRSLVQNGRRNLKICMDNNDDEGKAIIKDIKLSSRKDG